MESVPDAIVQHILSQLNNARDIASCSCISKRFNETIPYIPSLYFPRSSFDSIPRFQADLTMTRMISSAVHLQELVIYCPFSGSSLESWLSLRSPTLKILELRMDMAADSGLEHKPDSTRIDSIGLARNLEALKLWGVSLSKSPSWAAFAKLQSLEIVGAAMRDEALNNSLKACPNLRDLILIGCDGVESLVIDMERLENCRLDFLGMGNSSLTISSPVIRALEVQGFGWVYVGRNHRLVRLGIGKTSGKVYKIDTGKLAELEYLSIKGVQWTWSAVDSILRYASEVKHLFMKIEFTGDHDTLQPFPEIDFVEFFNGHPKLKSFEIQGAMFAALCQKNSLKNLDWRFSIPCLEEVRVTVRSPLNADQKMNTLESLVKFSSKLCRMVIRVVQMKGCHDAADEFFLKVGRFQFINRRIVRIE